MTGPAMLALFVVVDVLACWAAGYLLAMENVIAGTRERYENWAYRDAEAVREDETHFAVDQFWDRAELWAPFRRTPGTFVPVDGSSPNPAGVTHKHVPGPYRPFSHRGRIGMALDGVKGRKVPTRLAAPGGKIRYAVPTLDYQRLGKLDIAATVLRTKLADLWGCPKCAGAWGGAAVSLALSHWGPWQYGWPLVLGLHVAAWGAARRLGWGE